MGNKRASFGDVALGIIGGGGCVIFLLIMFLLPLAGIVLFVYLIFKGIQLIVRSVRKPKDQEPPRP
jgi:uncharacterized membrane protein